MRLVHASSNALAKEACELYYAGSALPILNVWGAVEPSLVPYLRFIVNGVGSSMPKFEHRPERILGRVRDNGTCWVAFSGGKDGMAAALLIRELGYTPLLYHVRGINRSWPNEYVYASSAATAADMRMVVDRVAVSGKKKSFIELPVKNQVIISLMVARMLDNGGAVWSMGANEADTPEASNPLFNWSDTTIAMDTWAAHMEARVFGLRFLRLLRNEAHSLAIVAKYGLLPYVNGCMSPLRFRKYWRAENVKKFGDAILPGRCGICYKCWSERLMLEELGVVPVHEKFRERALAGLARLVKNDQLVEWHGTAVEDPGLASVVEEFRGISWPAIEKIDELWV